MSQMEPNLEKTLPQSHRRQYLVCGILCLGGFLAGTGQGWSSTALPSIKESGDFPEISTSNLSWVASITMLGAFVGSATGGYLIRKLGRKGALLISTILYIIGWTALTIPYQFWMLYAGRFFMGVGLGLMVLAGSVYLSEIAQPEIRGGLTVIWFVAIRLGILFEYGVGSILPYDQLSAISVVTSFICGVSICFLPESPRWLVGEWKLQKAIDSLCWLRACDKSSPSPQILREIEEIKEAVLRTAKETQTPLKTLLKYFTNGMVRKSMLVASIVMFAKESSGGNVFSFYTVQVFEKTGSALESHLSGVVVGVAQLAGILLTTYYVDKVGRRILLITSFVMMGSSIFFAGLFYQFKSEVGFVINYSEWIPLILFMTYHAAFSGGPFVLTYTAASEIIPTNVIGSVSGLVSSLSWFLAFVLIRYYEDMNSFIGIANTFWFYAVLAIAGALGIHLLVPETVGASLESIHDQSQHKFNDTGDTLA